MTNLQFWALLTPSVVALIASYFAFRFGVKGKKFDLYFQNKIPAFKEISQKITDFKNYCDGRVAYHQGSEFAPFYSDTPAALHHRTEIATSLSLNSIYFSEVNKKSMENLIRNIGTLCNIEMYELTGNDLPNTPIEQYEKMIEPLNKLLQQLFNELQIKN